MWIYRLIWVFAGHAGLIVGFVVITAPWWRASKDNTYECRHLVRISVSNLSSYLPIYFSDCIHAVWSGPSLSANIIIDTTELQTVWREMPGWYFPQAKDDFVHTEGTFSLNACPLPHFWCFFFFFFFFFFVCLFFFASKGSLFFRIDLSSL